jgi:hypothetical protein
MLDTAELHQLFIKKLTLFLIIKHIIKKEKHKIGIKILILSEI